jgi:hypothetical protein
MSLVHSARINGHDSYARLRDVLEALAPRSRPAGSQNSCRIAGKRHAQRADRSEPQRRRSRCAGSIEVGMH